MDSRKPLTAESIKEIVTDAEMVKRHSKDLTCLALADGALHMASLLTSPTDAAVRDAVERMARLDYRWGKDLGTAAVRVDDIRTLLRAVQAPRPTGEQVEAVKWAKRFIVEHGGQASAWVDERHSQGESEDMDRDMENGLAKLVAAFPELAGEVGRG